MKSAATEGIANMSWGQKILGAVAGYKGVTGMMGSFYDSAVKPINNWVDNKENAVCKAIGD